MIGVIVFVSSFVWFKFHLEDDYIVTSIPLLNKELLLWHITTQIIRLWFSIVVYTRTMVSKPVVYSTQRVTRWKTSYPYYPSDWYLDLMKSNHVQISALGFMTLCVTTKWSLLFILLQTYSEIVNAAQKNELSWCIIA